VELWRRRERKTTSEVRRELPHSPNPPCDLLRPVGNLDNMPDAVEGQRPVSERTSSLRDAHGGGGGGKGGLTGVAPGDTGGSMKGRQHANGVGGAAAMVARGPRVNSREGAGSPRALGVHMGTDLEVACGSVGLLALYEAHPTKKAGDGDGNWDGSKAIVVAVGSSRARTCCGVAVTRARLLALVVCTGVAAMALAGWGANFRPRGTDAGAGAGVESGYMLGARAVFDANYTLINRTVRQTPQPATSVLSLGPSIPARSPSLERHLESC